jgi:hypothetical protein
MQQLPTITDLIPSDDDVVRYRESGVYLSDVILPEQLLDQAVDGMERFYRGDRDWPFPGDTGQDRYGWTPADGDGLRKNDYTALQMRELAALVRYPTIGAVAAKLSGARSVRLWHDQLLYKPPQSAAAAGNVGWHTDRQYWQSCSSQDMLTAWVPLVDVDHNIGTVNYIIGSHQWPDEDLRGLDFFAGDNAAQERRLTRSRSIEKMSAVLRRGQVAFHHCRTIHGSGPNVGQRVRRSVAIHLQPGDNNYVASTQDDGSPAHHRNNDLVRRDSVGRPDYTDPRICPRLWPLDE